MYATKTEIEALIAESILLKQEIELLNQEWNTLDIATKKQRVKSLNNRVENLAKHGMFLEN